MLMPPSFTLLLVDYSQGFFLTSHVVSDAITGKALNCGRRKAGQD
jgi:hypothetical protein